MKKILALIMILALCLTVCGCSNSSNNDYETKNDSNDDYSYSYENDDNDYNYSYDDDDADDYSYFSNKYGSKTTKCAQSGCSNYIASSGDTAYCVTHSNKCLDCRCYIDGDAMYCMDCLSDAANDINDDYDYGSNNYSHECYVCGEKAYSKYGSYYYCSSCLALVKAFS